MAQTPPTFARPVKQSVYDVGTLSWLPMTQPLIAGGTITATVSLANPLPVSIAATVAVSGTFYQATQPVSVASTVAVKEVRAATPTQSTVADSASSVTVLASNANRLGASIENDSSAVLYLKLGATASITSYTVRMVQYAYYEVPSGYTGVIDGIWATDPGDGAARVTELAT